MPSSTVSLEPLSSPSPSPPPPESKAHSSISNHSGAGAGLDSGSELSELTEDEQENDTRRDHAEERPRPTRRGERKKRSLIPTPMWDWVKKDTNWRNRLIEEEEEEEQAGPVKAQEEEEDEGHEENDPTAIVVPSVANPLENGDDEPEEEDPPEDDDDAPDEGADQSTIRAEDTTFNTVEPVSDEDEPEPPAESDVDDAPLPRPSAREPSPNPSDEENVEEEEVDPDAGIDEPEPQDPDPPAESEDEADNPETLIPNGTSTEVPSTPVNNPPLKPSAIVAPTPATKSVEPEATTTPMDVDDVTPTPAAPPVVATIAQSSIMAGADVVAPPSPSASSSASASPRASPSPSRSPSPEPVSDREADSKTNNGRASAKGKVTGGKAQNTRLTRTRSRRKARGIENMEQDAGDNIRLAGEGDDRDLVDADEVDIDSPDMELETDVLPVHRAEALDVLAQIELKFALLRDKLYVEKMESLAWEETLIAEDNHPEMVHLQAELDKRRDKRLDLAARRRDFEVANITKRRKLDEGCVWSWWKDARDNLQAEMTSEMNRRRRKLDRERRNLDRPQPVRPIPGPPLEIPNPPTVYEIVKADPFNAPPSRHGKIKKPEVASQHLVYPQLTSLSHAEVANDLEFLYSIRRPIPFDHGRPGIMGPGPMIPHPMGVPPGFDPFNMGIPMLDGPGVVNRFGPGPPPPMQHLPQPHIPMPYPGPPPGAAPRLPHHATPQPLPPPMMDVDSGSIRRPSSVPGHLNHQPFPPPGSRPGPMNLMRRSISPVPVFTNGQSSSMHPAGGPRPQGWVGDGIPGPSSLHATNIKEGRWPNGNDHGFLDRDKDRDRLLDSMKQKERERYERDEREGYHVQHALPRHPSHTHPHTHIHGPGHHHHHHIVHHHHPNSSINGLGGGGHIGGGGPMMANGIGPGSSNMSSPRMRELDMHRPRSGAPTEVIDLALLSGMSTKQGGLPPSSMSAFWKGNEDQGLLPGDRDRDRSGRLPPPLNLPPVGPHERMAPPFPFGLMGGGGYPPSPRHGSSTAPGSKAPSRRGSFSALDDNIGPRPSSSHSLGALTSNHSSGPTTSAPAPHRQAPSGSHGGDRRLHQQVSPLLQPQHSGNLLSPRGNGIRLPPLSPSHASPMGGGMRSPVRSGQGGPSLPPISSSHPHSHSHPTPPPGALSKTTSPIDARRRSPPPMQTRSPLTREPHPQSLPPPSMNHPRTSSPMIMLPPPSTLSNTAVSPAPPPRLPPVGLTEKHSPSLPKMKVQAVPIDGS